MSPFISLLTAHYDELLLTYRQRLSPDMRRAISAMCLCKTDAAGLSQWYCKHCHSNDRLPLSCGHRHCQRSLPP